MPCASIKISLTYCPSRVLSSLSRAFEGKSLFCYLYLSLSQAHTHPLKPRLIPSLTIALLASTDTTTRRPACEGRCNVALTCEHPNKRHKGFHTQQAERKVGGGGGRFSLNSYHKGFHTTNRAKGEWWGGIGVIFRSAVTIGGST